MSRGKYIVSTEKEVMGKEREILEHEPVPGYRTVFHIAVAVACFYLFSIFMF
ncbi:MAG: hypothetical protein K9K79_11000 [Desulfohalobiaceae bacterium]|nr:hypothetical protein [Desulfohalobiaceae bacterium]